MFCVTFSQNEWRNLSKIFKKWIKRDLHEKLNFISRFQRPSKLDRSLVVNLRRNHFSFRYQRKRNERMNEIHNMVTKPSLEKLLWDDEWQQIKLSFSPSHSSTSAELNCCRNQSIIRTWDCGDKRRNLIKMPWPTLCANCQIIFFNPRRKIEWKATTIDIEST